MVSESHNALRERHTAAEYRAVVALAGVCMLVAFAPASRDLAPERERAESHVGESAGLLAVVSDASAPALAPEALTPEMLAPETLATETVVTRTLAARAQVEEEPTAAPARSLRDADRPSRRRSRDVASTKLPRTGSAPEVATDPALISWWDADHWTAIEDEQDDWRRDWLREARRNPENVPAELWPRIIEWAPYDRSLARSARAAIRSAPSTRRYGRFELDDAGDRARRWARDMLRRLEEANASRRTRRPRRPSGA